MSETASCHCGATRITLPAAPAEATSCNCTFCQRTGALWAYYRPDEIAVEAKDTRDYAPSGMNHHHFCGSCGMHTHGFSPDWGSIYNDDGTPKEGVTPGAMPEGRKAAVNLRMLPDLDLDALQIIKLDGRNGW